MMAITLVLALGMVWVSTRSKFVPYVVEVDNLGYAIGAPPPQALWIRDGRYRHGVPRFH